MDTRAMFCMFKRYRDTYPKQIDRTDKIVYHFLSLGAMIQVVSLNFIRSNWIHNALQYFALQPLHLHCCSWQFFNLCSEAHMGFKISCKPVAHFLQLTVTACPVYSTSVS